MRQRAAHFWEKLGPQCVFNGILFAALAAAGIWWAYPLLWLVPLLTWMMVITRVRNIAEHAVVPDSHDPLRNTRTTHANFLERLFISPRTVKAHCDVLRQKLGVSRRRQIPVAYRLLTGVDPLAKSLGPTLRGRGD